MALKEHFGWKPWNEWEEGAAFRRPEVLRGYRHRLAVSVLFWQFVQYEFFCQWHQLKEYAGRNGIKIIGDLPFTLLTTVPMSGAAEIFLPSIRKMRP